MQSIVHKKIINLPVMLLSASIAATIPTAAFAATTTQLEEVVVTSQKREQSAQDTPISVTVLSGDAIQYLGIESSNDIADYTPGLKISPVFGVGNIPNISIRGVGLNDFKDYHESPSAVYVDEVYKAALASLDFQLFDVDRVEVLKGPQGTLFGRNATGGLIQYVTKKPSEATEGYLKLGAGSFGDVKVEAAVGGSLSETVTGRLSMLKHKNDGIQQNVNPDGEDANQIDLMAVRGQLKFAIADSGSLLLSVENASNENDGGNPYRYAPSFAGSDGLSVIDKPNRDSVVGTSDLNDINVSSGLSVTSDYTSGTARLELPFENFDLVAISNFQDFEKRNVFQDCDSAGYDLCFTSFISNTTQYSQEIRLQGGNDGLQWDAGVYYFNLSTEGAQELSGPIAGMLFGDASILSSATAFDTTTISWATFGQVAYDLSDTLTLTAGLRYTNDKKEMEQIFLLGVMPGGMPYDLAIQDDSNTSYLAKLTWNMSDNTMIYGGVSNAHKAGSFNTGFGPVAADKYSVAPEELISYEAGFKTESDDGRNRLTGAFFYYDYQNHQAFVYKDLTQLLFNADAEVTGAEFEWTGLPADGLMVSVGASFLDTSVKDVQDGSGAIRDREMVLAPEVSMNALVRYTWNLASGSELVGQLDGTYSSEVFFDNLNQPGLLEGPSKQMNARLSWLNTERDVEVSAWVKNLTDEEYRLYAFDLTADLGYIQESYHAPRTIGVSVNLSF